MSDFSKRLIELRKSKELSQLKLSELLGVSKSTVAMWESGQRTPTYNGYEEIADFFNVDVDYLRGKQDIKNKYQQLLKSIEQGQLLGRISSDKVLMEELEKLLSLSADKQSFIYNQIDFLYSQQFHQETQE